ncbi:MAG: MBL fold metallo-hydrolase [Myxococcota bacterium]|nr:MBL fold metallo-hydrolase [Myxococcota bacterium]
MEVEFLGAAQTVTGSMHLVHTASMTLLLDCGLFQGRRREAFERNRNLPLDPLRIDAVIVSHAHIDHSGALPLLVKRGFVGPIYVTPATRDLCAVMLEDAAVIQEADARTVARIARLNPEVEPVEPLYSRHDATAAVKAMVSVPYRKRHAIGDGVAFTFHDAGHVLGSSSIALDCTTRLGHRRLVFSGDLGRNSMPILRDPEIPGGADALILESTYGDRLHPPLSAMEDELEIVIRRAVTRGGKVIIPAFALERAQELIHVLHRLHVARRLPEVPIFIDSPLTVKVTDVFKLHPDCYDEETSRLFEKADGPFEVPGLRYVSDVEESRALSASSDPAVIISASGMCEAGRVLHHLRATISDRKNIVVIVGFQAQHTLGRRLVEGRDEVRIFGLMHDRKAEVVVLNGFSAHADQSELIAFAEAVRAEGKVGPVALVHGELPAQQRLRELLVSRGFAPVTIPARGDRLRV